MKPLAAFAVAMIAVAVSAAAQSTTPPQPDYSRESLQRFVASIPEPPPEGKHNVHFGLAGISFTAFGQQWRIGLLPPLSGSIPRTTLEWPDPFLLTRTEIATTPRTYASHRALNAEMRRIRRLEKRARVQVR